MRTAELISPLALTALLAAACAPPNEEYDASEVEMVQSAVTTTHSEYKLPASVDPEVLSVRATELWAAVYRPQALVSGKRYPLIIFLHGNHYTCGRGSNPRIDEKADYTTTGACPSGYTVAPSHAGYQYIGQELASNEYIVVSINANRGISAADGVDGDGDLIMARGRLILKHLSKLSRWDRGLESTPSSLGFSFRNRIDFNNVGIMGHSRGGQGARAALHQFRDFNSPWPGRIPGLRIRSVFEIAPTDSADPFELAAFDIRWAVLLPICDGDVGRLEGIKVYDRMNMFGNEEIPNMKATWTVWGANHNYYNTQWQESDTEPEFCFGHQALFPANGPGVTGSAAQRTTGRVPVVSFFRGSVGATNSSHRRMFNPLYPVPSSVSSVTRIERNYTPSPDSNGTTTYLMDFFADTGWGDYGLPNVHSNITVAHEAISHHDSTMQGGNVTWTSAGSNRYFQTVFTDPGFGLPLNTHKTLDIRVERDDQGSFNPSSRTDFSVQLVNPNGSLSNRLAISSFVTLLGPVAGPAGTQMMLQTARIPLTRFTGVNLAQINGIRFTFDRTSRGRVWLAQIHATGNSDDNAALSSTSALAASEPTTEPQPISAAAVPPPSPQIIVLGNQVVAVRPTGAAAAAQGVGPGGLEIELATTTQFPMGDAGLRLRIGATTVGLSRLIAPERVVFVLTPAQAAQVRNGNPMVVPGLRREWHFGPLRK